MGETDLINPINEGINFVSPNINVRNKYEKWLTQHMTSVFLLETLLQPRTERCVVNDSVHRLNFQPWQADVQDCCIAFVCFWPKQRQIAAWRGVVHL